MNESKLENQGLKFDLTRAQEPSAASEIEEEKVQEESSQQLQVNDSALLVATD